MGTLLFCTNAVNYYYIRVLGALVHYTITIAHMSSYACGVWPVHKSVALFVIGVLFITSPFSSHTHTPHSIMFANACRRAIQLGTYQLHCTVAALQPCLARTNRNFSI
jgi:hypothetical protein